LFAVLCLLQCCVSLFSVFSLSLSFSLQWKYYYPLKISLKKWQHVCKYIDQKLETAHQTLLKKHRTISHVLTLLKKKQVNRGFQTWCSNNARLKQEELLSNIARTHQNQLKDMNMSLASTLLSRTNNTIQHWKMKKVSKAFNQLVASTKYEQHKEKTLQKLSHIVRQWKRKKLASGLRQWSNFTAWVNITTKHKDIVADCQTKALKQLMVQIVLRIKNTKTGIAMRLWKKHVLHLQHYDRLVKKVMNRWQKSMLYRMLSTWKQTMYATKQHRQALRLVYVQWKYKVRRP